MRAYNVRLLLIVAASLLGIAPSACASTSSAVPAGPDAPATTILQRPIQDSHESAAARDGFLTYHGGGEALTPRIYLVYMGWNRNDADPAGEAPRIEAFLKGVGGSKWLNVVTQYAETRGPIVNAPNQLKGTWHDDHPASGLIDEAMRAANYFHDDRFGAQFVLLSPHRHSMAGFGSAYCSLRTFLSRMGGGRSTAVATYLGYLPDAGRPCGAHAVNKGKDGVLDAVTLIAAAQVADFQTDVHTDAWYHENDHSEIADACWRQSRNVRFSTGVFPVPALWSNAARGCVASYP